MTPVTSGQSYEFHIFFYKIVFAVFFSGVFYLAAAHGQVPTSTGLPVSEASPTTGLAVQSPRDTLAQPMPQNIAGTRNDGKALTPWPLLTATAGLIAFHIGFYTLVGRERKSPYIINSIYYNFFLCLIIASIALSSVLLPSWLEEWALRCSTALLVVAFLLSAIHVYRIAVRSIYFVDSLSLKNLPPIRYWRRRKALNSPRPNYAHNTIPIPEDLKVEIIKILSTQSADSFQERKELDLQSLALAVDHQGQQNFLLAQLATEFLKRKYSVQYLTASRHPIEFIGYLKEHLRKNNVTWSDITRRIVVIDAYSPHFAFLDSIYAKKDREMESLDISCVVSKMTYAGMHSASSRAFNVIQAQVKDENRQPTLVIYEETYALTDLESPEQYRIFVRHVMPSERMWDGMFTVFVESAQLDGDWRILQSYASMRLNLRSDGKAPKKSDPCPADQVDAANDRHTKTPSPSGPDGGLGP